MVKCFLVIDLDTNPGTQAPEFVLLNTIAFLLEMS
jgi:hypothetical protein